MLEQVAIRTIIDMDCSSISEMLSSSFNEKSHTRDARFIAWFSRSTYSFYW